MDFKDISLPEIYNESQDFRFFVDWFVESLTKIEYDTTNFFDLYDPLRCPKHLLWALADTIGYKYDDRLPASFNRLVLLNFMSMIRNKGSKNGITLAAETNLGQFDIYMQAQGYVDENNILHEGNEELYDRLENTSVPVNSVYVTPHTEAGYIDIVYFSTKKPKDACIEYVRPLGMYCFQHSGVKFDGRTKISVDARLTNDRDKGMMDYGPAQVGHYSREDYARLQKNDSEHIRRQVWKSNVDNEGKANPQSREEYNPGYRALYSLQLCNNEHIVKALIDPIFSLGYGPQDITTYMDDYVKHEYEDHYSDGTVITGKPWNLRYDKDAEENIRFSDGSVDSTFDIETLDSNRDSTILDPAPAVNPIMSQLGDCISMNDMNTQYTKVDNDGNATIETVSED